MMDGSPALAFRVNELTPDPNVPFDPKVVKELRHLRPSSAAAGWSIRASAAW